MAKKEDKLEKKYSKKVIEEYQGEYSRWLNKLTPYHTGRFQTNYNQYTAYAQTKGTHSKISDPIAPELTERIVQKLFERPPKFFCKAKGRELPREITDTIANIADYFWGNPDIIQTTGNRKSALKVLGREFCVTGNAATETYFNFKADSPDFRIIPIEDVVFNPTKTLKTSDRYYIRQFVSMEYLENMAEHGVFKNIDQLKIKRDNEDDTETDENVTNRIIRVGSTAYQKPVGKVELTSIWTGKKLCQIADWSVIVREIDDPMSLGEDSLDFVMDVELVGEPYGLSFLDFISGLTKGKDLILNQVIDYGAKALNPPLFVDPSLGVFSKNSLRNAWQLGGIVFANPQQASHQQMAPLPQVGMDMLGYMQQRAESTSGISAYQGGIPNQISDKTRGTYRGISALIEQGQSPISDRQKNIEESIIEPIINKWMKMAAKLMTKNEIKYALVAGTQPKWIRVTKGLLAGKVTLDDLYQAELLSEEEAAGLAATMTELGQDPAKEMLFDVDWVLGVEAGSMAEIDKEKQLQEFDQLIQTGVAMGVPIDLKKVWIEKAHMMGKKEPEQYIIEQQPIEQGMEGVEQPLTAPPVLPPGDLNPMQEMQKGAQESVNKRMAIVNKRTLPSM